MKIPALVAHRGYTLHYPENTLVGIEAAIVAGARYVEVDVQLTSDQVPVLYHDRTLERISNQRGSIHDYTAEQLGEFRAFDFGRFGYKFAQEPIATLAAFAALLARYPKVTAFVEVKRIAVQRFGNSVVLSRMLRELHPVLRQCVLISYSLETLLHARQQGWPALGVVIDRWQDRNLAMVRQTNPEYLFCDSEGLPRFGKLRFANARLAVFEITDAALALKLGRRGAELIETYAIGELQTELERLTAT
jgi:glycerophosphoryl diester phosphodiesterase